MKSNVSLLRRLGAIIYDAFLAFSLVFFVGMIVIAIFDDIGNAFLYLITLPTVYLYFALSWVKGRQTIGMKAWKFQVIQHNQQNITHSQAFVRFTLGLASFSVFGLGFIYQLFNKDNLSWHDKLSNTLLIKN
ncbi:MAG: RDD family protein [Candidatus Thioglobus sp.]|uniref:RDD family protein n=1 Tax=Candidatus Thioglobus sp. TaxID=2026721 RepID=UPI00261A2735|nr:RDD family protein [Candidatus Thioglobus sp.]MDC9726592.1 RDD family protein [Candidatus Thioglobus sp.]